MAGKVRKFVSREFAKTVDLDLLARFLSPHADAIALDWEALPSDDSARRDAIYELFRGADDRFPSALQDALHRACIISTPGGTRLLLEQADERGVQLVPDDEVDNRDGRHLDPRHLALRAYLDHRDLFDAAVHVASYWSAPTSLTRVGASEGVLPRHEDDAAREAFRAAASQYFAGRYKGRFCDVHWYPDEDEVGLLVLHGKNPRTASVEEDGAERTLAYREIAEDIIRYQPDTGMVKVGAANAKDASTLLRLFAEYLIGDTDFFEGDGSDELYTLEPIREQGGAFRFAHDWDPDVQSVVVREIQIDEGEQLIEGRPRFSPWAATIRDTRNAVQRLGEIAPDADLRDLQISHVKLQFNMNTNGQRSQVTVKVKPPNVASFRDHSFEAKIMEHLERNGFRVPSRAQPLAAAAE